jgi:DNA-binding IscR family transcriptional regulator
MLGADYFNR